VKIKSKRRRRRTESDVRINFIDSFLNVFSDKNLELAAHLAHVCIAKKKYEVE